MSIWYIDSKTGSDANTGMSELQPLATIPFDKIKAGDTVLLKCGSVFFHSLLSPSGEPDAPIRWSSYGEGEKPVFCGSASADQESDWEAVGENIWRWTNPVHDEMGNIIFNDGESYGTLRWEYEDLAETGDFYFTHFGREGNIPEEETPELYLYVPENPGKYYDKIDIALFGARRMVRGDQDVIFENMMFKNGGVHGFAAENAQRIQIKGCDFINIGGCAWSEPRHIRFGNGVEFWQGVKDALIENCTFHQIYDSCYTYQGSGVYPTPTDVTFRNCTCEYYGMAAFEVREILGKNSVFENNVCKYAGMGFAMQGEELPRQSEIWPQPMGHHVFLWRVDECAEDEGIVIRNNYFESAPVGSVEYSIISAKVQEHVEYSGNTYQVEHPEKAVYRQTAYVENAVL